MVALKGPQLLKECTTMLRECVQGARKAVRVSILRTHRELEDWVSDVGRLVLIGEAAHPFPPGSIQGTAMAVDLITMAAGAGADARDASMRRNAAQGRNVLQGDGSAESVWDEYCVVFGYDCEDAADDWWVKLLLRERPNTIGNGMVTVEPAGVGAGGPLLLKFAAPTAQVQIVTAAD